MKMFKKFKPLVWGISLSLLSTPAFAGLGGNSIITGLNNLIDLITGDIGTALCTLAIIAVGFAWLKLGRLEKEQAIGTILGIGLVYSASYLAQQFGAG